MRPKVKTLTLVTAGESGTASSAIVMDPHISPFNIGFGVTYNGNLTGTDIQYSVEHTFDDPLDADGLSGATWFRHESVTATNGNADGSYDFPVRAIRVSGHVSAGVSGGGQLEITVIQAGI